MGPVCSVRRAVMGARGTCWVCLGANGSGNGTDVLLSQIGRLFVVGRECEASVRHIVC